MNRSDALTGALVADAAALGLHWLYDQEHLARVASSGSVLFRQPDANVYAGVKGFFAQGGRVAGQLSHYGESARLVGQLYRSNRYSTAAHRASFLQSFGPCGTFCGYADRPTKALIGHMLSSTDDVKDPSGIDDDQMPGLCPVAGAFAGQQSVQAAIKAVQVISTNTQVMDSTQIIYTCLESLLEGVALIDALALAATSGSGDIHRQLQDALSLTPYQPQEAAVQFGLACHVPQGMPVVWHLLNHAESFETAVYDNVLCGGDSCGRAMILGAIAGVAFGVPESLVERMHEGILPAR